MYAALPVASLCSDLSRETDEHHPVGGEDREAPRAATR